MKRLNLNRQKFTYLTALYAVGVGRQRKWKCRCKCGNISYVATAALRNGAIKSCGCFRHRDSHGLSKTRTYRVWMGMRDRCNNPQFPAYPFYGGRGITVSKEWNDYTVFLKDMGERPKGLSLDRIDNDGDYRKDNCKWSTQKEQMRNMRGNHIIEYDGKSMCVAEWAEYLDISLTALRNRLHRKWSIKRALTTPIAH